MGAVDYIAKPFQAEEVIARVETHLTIARLRSELAERNRQLEAANQPILTRSATASMASTWRQRHARQSGGAAAHWLPGCRP